MRATSVILGLACASLLGGCSLLLDFGALKKGTGDGGAVSDMAGQCPTFPPGGPTFTPDDVQTFPGQIGQVNIGDFDGDGQPDIVYGTNGTPTQVELLLNSGARNFKASFFDTGCKGSNESVTSVSVGNFDGLAGLDVITTCDYDDGSGTRTQGVYLLSGDGHGTLGAPQAFAHPKFVPYAGVADLDLDGSDDLIVSADGDAGIAIYFGGSGLLTQTPVAIATGVAPVAMAARTIANGRPTLVVAHIDTDTPPDTSHLSVISPMAGTTRGFSEPNNVRTMSPPINGVIFGKFTNTTINPYPDVILTSADTSVQLLTGQANDTFVVPPKIVAMVSGDQNYAAAGDLDCDGIDDAIITHYQSINSTADVVTFLLGGASGSFTGLAETTYMDTGQPNDVQIADFDGDGRLDAVIGVTNATSIVRVLWSNPP